MLIKEGGRPVRRLKNVQGGSGEITLHDLATPETLPKNIRVLSYITLKPGESVGEHRHASEAEVYHCIQGEGQVLDGDERIEVSPGDTVVLPSGTLHGLKNMGLSDLVILAVVVRD
ncbi:MAG: cupin domain-containing protein [Eubacteriales bacterium]